jgi:hypothetical protein
VHEDVLGAHLDLDLVAGTPEPVTVCLGTDGRCTDDPAGPADLRGEGLTVPPNHRVRTGWAEREATVHLTLAGLGPDVPNRNALLKITKPPSANAGP